MNDLAQDDEGIVASLYPCPSLLVARGRNQHLIHAIALEIGARHPDQAHIWLVDPLGAQEVGHRLAVRGFSRAEFLNWSRLRVPVSCHAKTRYVGGSRVHSHRIRGTD